MAFQRSGGRGSRYQAKKIDPVTLYIAYEGAEDEAKYFDALALKIPRQFAHLLVVVPVAKSTTASAPIKVYADLDQYLIAKNIKLSSANKALLVIDTDHHFLGTHARSTMQVIKDCRAKNIDVLCSNPAFDLWILCHYIDVSAEEEEFLVQALVNQNDFVKKKVRFYRKGEGFDSIIKRTRVAIERENSLRAKSQNPDVIPPTDLISNVGKLFTLIEERGIRLLDSLD
jgi:hypothetical protein